MSFTEINGLWFLHDSYTVNQAAALIAGFDPNTVRASSDGTQWFENEHGLRDRVGINFVNTAFSALVKAIVGGTLAATIRRSAWARGWHEEMYGLGDDKKYSEQVNLADDDGWPQAEALHVKSRGIVFKAFPDWGLTTISRSDLVRWLHSRGMRSGFFFPDEHTDGPGYLDPNNPRYAPKLAAAVKAWEAVTDPKGKSPKQALDKWLREHATDFRMTDEEGNPINQAIEECSKIANWQPGGGAAKTPG